TGSNRYRNRSRRPGTVVVGLCLLYGPGRFVLEALRDDNPYELGTLTISQIMGLVMLAGGTVLLGVLLRCGGNVCEKQPSPANEIATAGEPHMG
ncbi:MAG: prolipoprotein diacylglyceryl transferase, partial [Phycisphaerales bacterium]